MSYDVKINEYYLLGNGEIGQVCLIFDTTFDLIVGNHMYIYQYNGTRSSNKNYPGYKIVKKISRELNPEYFL